MEKIKCIFCKQNNNRIVIEENGYEGRKCQSCGLIYISPRPSFPEIQNLYSHDRAHVSAKSRISGAFSERLCSKHNIEIIKKYIQNGSILEIGTGAGYFLDEARKEGFEVCGIELNNVLVGFIRNKLKIPCEDSSLDISLFNRKKFDIIYHSNVLSHLYDPVTEFKKINAKLKDNGILVFETGNLGDVEEKYYRIFTKFEYPDHLFFFGENNLKKLLRLTGFELIRIYRYSILPELLIIKILRKAIKLIKNQEVHKKLDSSSMTKVAPSNIANSDIYRFSFKGLIKNIYGCFFYFLRYKIGYIIPKKGRPQTVIVIAQKGN